jgi:serine/threonine-protein kinase
MAAPPNESKIAVGTMLVGKYRVVREIGRGGMAAVYEAEQLTIGKHVAVKVLAQELSASSIVIERFFREARAAASVKSPHIVDVYDSGRLEDGRPFIAMELLEGESLYDRMARIRLFDLSSTIDIICQCAKGLQKAHGAGIVHRDLKPENIFLLKNEEGEEVVKLLDFGLAKFYAPVNPDEQTKRLTREGAVFGTPAYMSPEQVKGQGNVDQRADLWALGCMAYECLTGRPVWNMDQGVAMTFAAIATSPIPLPSELRPDLPAEFDAWFRKCLERDPNNRYQTAKELSDALLAVEGDGPASGSSPNAAYLKPAASSPVVELSSDALNTERPPQLSPVAGASSPFPVAGPSSPRGADLSGPFTSVPGPTSWPSQVAAEQSGRIKLSDITQNVRGDQIPSSNTEVRKNSPLRVTLSSLLAVLALGGAGFVYMRFLGPQVSTPTVMSTASAAVSMDMPPTEPPVFEEEPKYFVALSEGQKAFSSGDVSLAKHKFEEAAALPGGAALSKLFIDQVTQTPQGPCKMAAFSHPRFTITAPAGRPTVAPNAKGAVVAWTDRHGLRDREHVFSVSVDQAGTPITAVRDLTPEATEASRPGLLASSDALALVYWDAKGREAGVRVRSLQQDGHIAKESILVGGAHEGQYWPSIEKALDGYWVVWQDSRDKDGDDIFIRKLDKNMDTVGPETRLTDYLPKVKGLKIDNARVPSVAVAANQLFVTYKLEKEQNRQIMRMRLPVNAQGFAVGLDDKDKDSQKNERVAGDTLAVSDDKSLPDNPQIACGRAGCFIAWHVDGGGAMAARIDAKDGKVIWKQRISDRATRPAIVDGAEGQVMVGFYEAGKVKVANFTLDGVGPSSTIAKIGGDHARPWLAPGTQKGEYWIAWEDFEAGRSEPFVARFVCK